MAKQFGPLPLGFEYAEAAYPTVAPLCVNELLALMMHGYLDVRVLLNTPTTNRNQTVWVMPWGTSHRATLETCGINRADLLALGDLLATQTAPAARETQTAPVVETKEQRQDRRLKACEDAGLVMPTSHLSRLPDGVGNVAASEGVTRQTYTTDVKAALKRREAARREGVTVHRA
jgi:hypothetical protein